MSNDWKSSIACAKKKSKASSLRRWRQSRFALAPHVSRGKFYCPFARHRGLWKNVAALFEFAEAPDVFESV